MSRPEPLALLAAALLLAGAAPAAAPSPQEGRPVETTVRPVDDVTRVLLAWGEEAPAQAVQHLRALGREALPRLLEILEHGRFRVRVGERGNTYRALDPTRRAALVETFRQTPREHVLALLRPLAQRTEPAPGAGERVVALEVLGLHSLESDLPLALALASPAPGERRVQPAVRTAFADFLARTLERQLLSTEAVLSLFRTAHPSLLAGIISTLGDAETPARLEHLTRLLGELAEADALLLAAIGRVAGQLPHPIEGPAAARVRPYLRHSRPQLLVEAALAAAKLEDREAVPFLIPLLDHADRNVAAQARRALRTITGRQAGPDPDRWNAWHESELAWWSREAPGHFETIRVGAPADAARVVMELAKKRFFRHQLTRYVAAGLERDEVEQVALTCSALGYLGSWTAVPHLVDALASGEDDVRSAAWRALQSITGLELGPERELWLPLAERWRTTR